MSKTKTEFRFTVNADMAMVNNVIQNYLAVNDFSPKPKANANYYYFNDPLIKGKRSFEYYINGNEVLILAYIGTFERPHGLEGAVGALPKQSYRNDLAPLFEELKKMDQQGQGMNGMPNQGMNGMPNQNMYANPNSMAQANAIDSFVEHSNQKKETWTIVGFVISLLGLVLSCFGMSYGIVLLILEFYCGIQGIHTKKKGLAIATIVIACVSIAILVLEVILTILGYAL